jgi:uncharacterized protein (TIGR02391 family)
MSENDKALILDQVKDLKRRTKSAINSGSDSLTQSLVMEYADIVANASIQSLLGNKLTYEFSSLKADAATIPLKSKDDPLAQLKWLDNSISKLEMLVKRLIPTDTKPESELHPKVLAASGKLLKDGHYPQAVFEAFKALEAYVKAKSGVRNKTGKALMTHVFSESKPILKIKPSLPDTANEEQEGFKFLFMGAMLGIRNPKAHYGVIQKDKVKTIQYLALASLLFKTVDEATLVQKAES